MTWPKLSMLLGFGTLCALLFYLGCSDIAPGLERIGSELTTIRRVLDQ